MNNTQDENLNQRLKHRLTSTCSYEVTISESFTFSHVRTEAANKLCFRLNGLQLSQVTGE